MRLTGCVTFVSLLSAVTLVALPLEPADQSISISRGNEFSINELSSIKSVKPRSGDLVSFAPVTAHKLHRRNRYWIPDFRFRHNNPIFVLEGLKILWTFVPDTNIVDVVTFINKFAQNVVINLYSSKHGTRDEILHTWNIGPNGVENFNEMNHYRKIGEFVWEFFTLE